MWWIVLFAILPFGVRSQHESGDYLQGTDPGAPVAPKLAMKAVITTIVSAVLFAGLYAYIEWVT
jgi:predicted secreted protein